MLAAPDKALPSEPPTSVESHWMGSTMERVPVLFLLNGESGGGVIVMGKTEEKADVNSGVCVRVMVRDEKESERDG